MFVSDKELDFHEAVYLEEERRQELQEQEEWTSKIKECLEDIERKQQRELRVKAANERERARDAPSTPKGRTAPDAPRGCTTPPTLCAGATQSP